MTNQDVDKIIAKFMGIGLTEFVQYRAGNKAYDVCESNSYTKVLRSFSAYTESLDALVPVWEKMGNMHFYYDYFGGHSEDRRHVFNHSMNPAYGKTIQQAAAHATAKAIKELG